MTRRKRKLIGSIGMILFVIIYALAVMVIAQGRIQDAGKMAQLAFFVTAGLAWVLPVMPLIKWMERADPDQGG